jgi:hypothetical protein
MRLARLNSKMTFPLKISLGMKLQSGSWGGGNQFGQMLSQYLLSKGIEVSFHLKCSNLDLIVLVDPNINGGTSSYSHRDILRYLLTRNPHCLVIHRINNSSEARDDDLKTYNKFRITAGQVADHTVFISKWLHACYVEAGFNSPDYSIILNGGDDRLWQSKQRSNHANKLNLVTHHWSNNPKKGFDVYQRLDEMLLSSPWSEQVAFTYIGRVPAGFQFKATRYLEPISGQVLVEELQKHDIYLTAAQNEAAGMHHIEGALCGLPLLYRESGGLPEYCQGFGVSFTAENFEQKLQEILASYGHWAARIKNYPHTAERMCENYYNLFQELLEQRDELIKRRTFWRNPVWLFRTLLGL